MSTFAGADIHQGQLRGYFQPHYRGNGHIKQLNVATGNSIFSTVEVHVMVGFSLSCFENWAVVQHY